MTTEGRIAQNTIRVSLDPRTGIRSVHWGGLDLTREEEIHQLKSIIRHLRLMANHLVREPSKDTDD